MKLQIKDWNRYQHYKPKNDAEKPTWIKLYVAILDDFDFQSLPVEARALLPMLWLLAAEKSGNLPEIKKIAFRLRLSEREVENSIKLLINNGSIIALDQLYTNSIPDNIEKIEKKEEDIGKKEREEYLMCEKDEKNDFELIWKEYPDNSPKGNKAKAKEKYLKLLKQGEDHGAIIEGVRTYFKFCAETDQYNQHCVTWLNQRGWEGEWQGGKRNKPKASYVDKVTAAGQAVLRNLNDRMEADRDAPWNRGDTVGKASASATVSTRDHETGQLASREDAGYEDGENDFIISPDE